MRQSTQLILNTAIVYGRMGIGFVVGLLINSVGTDDHVAASKGQRRRSNGSADRIDKLRSSGYDGA